MRSTSMASLELLPAAPAHGKSSSNSTSNKSTSSVELNGNLHNNHHGISHGLGHHAMDMDEHDLEHEDEERDLEIRLDEPTGSGPGGTNPTTNSENHNENIDIILNNVVCNFSLRCHINLRQLAMNGDNVEYHRTMAMLIMKLRKPRCTASIWSSGKVTLTGATTETDAKIGARRVARIIQKLGFNCKFTKYRIVNVLATCTMPFAIKIGEFAQAHPRIASYEPELHPGCTYKLRDIGATLKIFSTGSITITARSVNAVQTAVEAAYSLVYDYRRERKQQTPSQLQKQQKEDRERERDRVL